MSQGSPLSPSLFNLYIDELASRLSQVLRTIYELPENLFEDDLLIISRQDKDLQYLLSICSILETEAGLDGLHTNVSHYLRTHTTEK